MKTKKQDMRLRELFRQKLGNAEIIPSVSAKAKLMRKLAFREFLHFNPARFNIYYIGGVIVAGLTAAIILTSVNKNALVLPESNAKINITSPVDKNIPLNQTENNKTNISEKISPESPENKVVNTHKTLSDHSPQNSISADERHEIPQPVSDSFAKKKLILSESFDKSKLQAGIKSENPLFEASVTKGCTPLNVKFYNNTTAFDSCRWTFGDGGSSNERNPGWIFDLEGEYRVVLNIFSSDGSQTTYSEVITVYPKPRAQFEIAPEKAILPDDEIRFYNYSVNAVHFNWNFGDGSNSELFEPVHKYQKFSNYNVRLTVASDFGCKDSITVMNAFSASQYFIDFPNAFIPNDQGPTGGFYSSKSDEGAQVFHPSFSGVSEYHLKIFSKHGILIFESSDINIGWDGYFKGQLSEPGVYVWKVRGNFRNGEPFIKMGDLTLLRK